MPEVTKSVMTSSSCVVSCLKAALDDPMSGPDFGFDFKFKVQYNTFGCLKLCYGGSPWAARELLSSKMLKLQM